MAYEDEGPTTKKLSLQNKNQDLIYFNPVMMPQDIGHWTVISGTGNGTDVIRSYSPEPISKSNSYYGKTNLVFSDVREDPNQEQN